MRVKIRFYAILREMAKRKEIEVELPESNHTVQDILDFIKEKNADLFKKIIDFWNTKEGPKLIILLNGRNIVHINGLKTKIKDNDIIDIFPPGGGG